MATKSDFSVLGCAHKFCGAFEKVGGTPEDLNTAAQSPRMLSSMLAIARDQAIIAPKATPNSRLELVVSGVEVPAIAASSKKVLPKGKLVWYRDSNLDTLLPEELPEAPSRVITGYKLLKDMTLQEIAAYRLGMPVASPDKLEFCFFNHGMDMAPGQVEFILANTTMEWNPFGLSLMKRWANFFFLVVNGHIVVLSASWSDFDARWYVCAHRFDYALRCGAECHVFFGSSVA